MKNFLGENREHEHESDGCRTGKDEMNLLEHSFSSASIRPVKSVDELMFERLQRDPNTGLHVPQRMSISFSRKYGRPTIEDDEVYVGLQAITCQRLKTGHTSPVIEFTRYELVQTIGWADSGPSYNNIDRAINRLGGVWIVCDNAFYDRAEASWVDKKFHIIDESHLFTREKYDHARTTTGKKRPKSWIRWGGPLFENFANGNLSTFDLGVYRAIKRGVAKKLYRYSNKRLWHKQRYVIDLRELAEDKLGFKRGQCVSELKRSLEPAFEELVQFGFNSTLKGQGNSKQVTVFRRKSPRKPKSISEPTAIEQQLLDRGIERTGKKSAAKLATLRPAEHVLEQIENYDDRLAHGEKLTVGWLIAAIESETGFGFRRGFKSTAQRKAEAEAKREGDRKRTAEREKEQRQFEEQRLQDEMARERFIRHRNGFSEAKQIELEDKALSKCDKFTRDCVLNARRKGEIGMFHQMLWEQHLMPDDVAGGKR